MKTKPASWKRFGRKSPMPKTGYLIGGSYRRGTWTMSSVFSADEFMGIVDKDRTHYVHIANPPRPTSK